MTTINQLSAVTSLNAGDQFPIFSSTQGDARKASMTTLAEFLDYVPSSFLNELAGPDGAGLSGFSHSSTYPAGTVGARLKETINAKDTPFNAVGDGTTSDQAALAAFFAAASGKNAEFGPGTFRLTALISVALTDCIIKGVPGETKITGNFGYSLLRLLDCTNVVFEDIIFENTHVNAVEDAGGGVVYSLFNNLTNVRFHRCTFTCPNANTNGVKMVASSVSGGLPNARIIKRVSFEGCTFESIGRMGFEVVNNLHTGVDRYSEVDVIGCFFKDNGLVGVNGMAVSLSGKGENCHIDNNTIENPLNIGIEFAGTHDSFARGNFFRNVTRTTALIATSDATAGSLPITGMTIADNKTDGYQSGGSVSFGDMSDSQVYGNTFNIGGYFDVRDGANNLFDMNVITTRGIYGVLFRNSSGKVCTNNIIDRTLVDCSGASAGSFLACIGNDGSGVTRNRIRRGKVVRPGAGNRLGRANGALQNWMEETDFDTTNWADTILFITLTGLGPITISPEQSQYNTIEFRGTLTANYTVFCDSGPDKTYTIRNATTGGFSIDFRPFSGAAGAVFPATKSGTAALRTASNDAILIGLFA